jgi:hypothetical protein
VSDQNTFQVGAVTFPLTSSTANSLLQDADPGIYQILAFYQAVLSIHLGARWDAEVTAAGLAKYAGKITTLAVPFDPVPFLTQTGFVPPILALYPTREGSSERTRAFYQGTGSLTLAWILPPFTAESCNRLYPFLRAAIKVIRDRTILGYDPAYESGALFAQLAGLAQLDLGQATYGAVPGLQTNMVFPAVTLELVAYELRMQTPALETLAGTDGTITVADNDNPSLITVVETQTTGS